MSKYAVQLCIGAILLLSAGCLRSSSGGSLEDPLSRALSTATPTFTPVPTQPPVTVVQTEVVVHTSTPDPAITQTLVAAQSIAQAAEATITAVPDTDTNTVNAQNVPETFPTSSDPLIQQATQIIADATQRVVDLTLTAQGPVVQLPTFTPSPDPLLVPSATPVPVGGPITPGVDCVHEIVRGENLFQLSQRYGLPIDDIAQRNGITNISLVVVGQKVTIPGCGTTGAVPPPTSVPTAAPNDTSNTGSITNTVNSGTGTNNVGTTTVNTATRRHIVRQYESVYELSLRYGVSVEQIASLNGLSDPYVIFIGQELAIP